MRKKKDMSVDASKPQEQPVSPQETLSGSDMEPKTSLDELVDSGQAEIASDVIDESPVLDDEIAIPDGVDRMLRMYPQYAECFVSKEGFVYPKDTPKSQRGAAVLYKNKYYNKNLKI